MSAPPDSPPLRAHADGASGSVSLIQCTMGSGSTWLGLEITPKQGESWRVSLEGLSASTPNENVRFVDVDEDGFPDPVLLNPDRKALLVAVVVLTSQVTRSTSTCANTVAFDHGSEGFLLGARSLDQAVAALSEVPKHGLNEKEACAFLAAPTPHPLVEVFGFPGSDGMLSLAIQEPEAIVTCGKKVPDGAHYLHPSVRCDSFRPYCEFGLLSGDTSLPPFERRYWFDPSKKQLTVVGVPQM
jgi:hypothetical protein